MSHYFYDLTHFRGQGYRNIFVRFLVQMKTPKSRSEINRPLATIYQCTIPIYLLLQLSSSQRIMTLFEQQLNCSDMLYDFFDNRVFSLRNHESSLKIYDSLTNVDVCICRTVLCSVQVNLFQKHLFLHQLTHNMTKDCSWNYHENYKCRI